MALTPLGECCSCTTAPAHLPCLHPLLFACRPAQQLTSHLPCRLAAPKEYLQYDVDQLDQNVAVNKAGNIVGKFSGEATMLCLALPPFSVLPGVLHICGSLPSACWSPFVRCMT